MQHAKDIGEGVKQSHEGFDGKGPTQRVSKQIKWTKMIAECIELAGINGREIVSSLIVDDGNEERSNRKVIFSKNLKYVGIACAPHKEFGTVTVINFIGDIDESAVTPGEPTPGNTQF